MYKVGSVENREAKFTVKFLLLALRSAKIDYLLNVYHFILNEHCIIT